MENDKKVLACVDHSQYAEPVAHYAAWAARSLKVPLVFVHALDRHLEQGSGDDHSGAIGIDAQENLVDKLAAEDAARTALGREQGRTLLNGLHEAARRSGIANAQVCLRHGTLGETLADQEPQARLVVLGRGADRSGSDGNDVSKVVETTVRGSQVPVLIVSEPFTEPESAMIAFDNGTAARHAIEMVASSALFQDMNIHLFMGAENDPERHSQLQWAITTLRAAGRDAHVIMQAGDVANNVAAALQEHAIDMLVMGAYGHSALRSMIFGSKTAGILQAVRVPILLLR